MPPEWSDPNRQKSLSDWLKRLESLHPSDIELGLDRIRAVWRRMGQGFEKTRIITIAGTNGKGSTATLTAELLRRHGWHVGLYTSPHFLRFNERVVTDGRPVSDAALVAALTRVEQARGDTSLTYFEFTTLAAFDLFGRAGLDALVLEVGLGGRQDAVNILDADCAAVTTIGLDHTDWLGETLPEIAREKAGIARSGRPLLVGAADAHDTFREIADAVGAELQFVPPAVRQEQGAWSPARPHPLAGTTLPAPLLPLPSAHLALQILARLGIDLEPALIADVLTRTVMPGRLQRLVWQGAEIWLDVAHNPQAATWVAGVLREQAPRWTIILGMLGDKDIRGVVQSLAILDPHWYLASLNAGPRSLTAEALRKRAELVQADCVDSVAQGIRQAVTAERPILVCGSFYTVSAALEFLQTD